MYRYLVIIEPGEHNYSAYVPDLPGCITTGATYEDVQKNIRDRSAYHRGFTHGIIMHFIDEAHLNAHHPHPAHQAVVEELDRLCQQTIDFDLPETG